MDQTVTTKTPGYLVQTQSGKGRTYHSEQSVNGKLVVHLLTDDLQHVLEENGKPRKILCDRKKVEILGYID